MIRILAIIAALLFAAPAFAIDAPVLDSAVASPSAIATTRAALINNAYGISTGKLPTTQPTVTQGVSDPWGGSLGVSLLRVDQYASTLGHGQTNVGFVYYPTAWNGNYISFSPGHIETCNWPSASSGYQLKQALVALLTAGYAVFTTNMPNSAPGVDNCGDTGVHVTLFQTYGDSAMQLFYDPIVQAMNYWDAHGGRGYYGMTGLSGGGWTTNSIAAVDPRVLVSVSIAGWLPGIVFNGTSPTGCGVGAPDGEQQAVDYFTIAGYLDEAMMGATGAGRAYVQILNVNDNCCFGPAQFTTCATQYGESWYQYTNAYFRQMQSWGVPNSFNLVWDYVAIQHQISSFAAALAVTTFNTYLHAPPTGVGVLAAH